MLKLPRKPCTLAAHINARTQKNGEEHVPFMDFKLSMLLTAKQTASLTGESHIAEAWFKTEGGELSDPLLKDWAPYRMKCKFKDSLCVLVVGVNAKEIDLGNVTIKSCTFEPVDRGSTQLTCTVQAPITNKSNETFLWMGHEIDAKLQFGEVELEDAQEKLELEGGGQDDDAAPADDDTPEQARDKAHERERRIARQIEDDRGRPN
jgi:hypothetical protein